VSRKQLTAGGGSGGQTIVGDQSPLAPPAKTPRPRVASRNDEPVASYASYVSTHAHTEPAQTPRAGDMPLGGSASGRGMDPRVHDRQGVRPDLARPRSSQPLGRAPDVLGRPGQGGEKN